MVGNRWILLKNAGLTGHAGASLLILAIIICTFVSCRESATEPVDPGDPKPLLPVWQPDTAFTGLSIADLSGGPTGVMALVDDSGRLFMTDDDGSTWHRVSTPYTSIGALTVQQSIIFAASKVEGVIRSTDLGLNWQSITDGMQDSAVFVLYAASSNILLAGTRAGMVYQSTNSGEFWHQRFFFNALVTSFSVWRGDTIIAGTWGTGVYRFSLSGGAAEHLSDGLTTPYILCLTRGPEYEVYAGAWSGGVFRTSDGGNFWQMTSDSLSSTTINSIAVDTRGRVIAATQAGIYISLDAGIHWTLADSGMGRPEIRRIYIDHGNVAFSATTAGLFRAPLFANTRFLKHRKNNP